MMSGQAVPARTSHARAPFERRSREGAALFVFEEDRMVRTVAALSFYALLAVFFAVEVFAVVMDVVSA